MPKCWWKKRKLDFINKNFCRVSCTVRLDDPKAKNIGDQIYYCERCSNKGCGPWLSKPCFNCSKCPKASQRNLPNCPPDKNVEGRSRCCPAHSHTGGRQVSGEEYCEK